MVSVCPICKGKGKMKASFYDETPANAKVQCKSCFGRGVIVDTEYIQRPVQTPPFSPFPSQRPWWQEPPMIPHCNTNVADTMANRLRVDRVIYG